jgi:hypothetical protein
VVRRKMKRWKKTIYKELCNQPLTHLLTKCMARIVFLVLVIVILGVSEADDRFHPQYHLLPPSNGLNDPLILSKMTVAYAEEEVCYSIKTFLSTLVYLNRTVGILFFLLFSRY